MSEQADWGAVPHAVVSNILWSDALHFLDRLRCQEVCQAWKSLLRERPGALPFTDLSTELCITFSLTTRSKERHIALRLDEDPPAIDVVQTSTPWSFDLADPAAVSTFQDNVSTCCRWLTLQARLIRKIQLIGNAPTRSLVPPHGGIGKAPTGSLVQEVVTSLQGASTQSPPAIAIMLPIGSDFLCNCEELLVNTLVALHFESIEPWLHVGKIAQMTHLTSLTLTGKTTGGLATRPPLNKLTLLQIQPLANLHALTLYGFREPDLELQWLQPLRRLCLGACPIDFCDLTSCTQLTSLTITWDLRKAMDVGVRKPRRLWLPSGSSVQLQHLCVSAVYKGIDFFEELKNLQDASRLMSMEFHNTYPGNLDERGWPLFMPHLNSIKADMMPDWPPQQLANYSQLRHLHIQVEHGAGPMPAMPTWLSHLTQLELRASP